jgi:response regulator of citrate/malate metabolism
MTIKKDPWMIKILKHLYDDGMAHTAEVARGAHIATTTAHKYLEKLLGDN